MSFEDLPHCLRSVSDCMTTEAWHPEPHHRPDIVHWKATDINMVPYHITRESS